MKTEGGSPSHCTAEQAKAVISIDLPGFRLSVLCGSHMLAFAAKKRESIFVERP